MGAVVARMQLSEERELVVEKNINVIFKMMEVEI